MNTTEAKTYLENKIEDVYEGRTEYSHMTGDIILSSRTADEVLQKIIDKRDGRK